MELDALRHVLRMYLGKKQKEGVFKRNSVRSYMNYFRILLKKSREFGAGRYSSEIEKQWLPISAALLREYGSLGIIRDAVARGIPPSEYSERHMGCWCEQMAKGGRHPAYIRDRASAFRKRLLAAGLNGLFSKLTFEVAKQNYGIPLESFPEPLKTQVNSVREWKLTPMVRGRPSQYFCRPVW